jgi:hypothetical protein
MFEFEVIELQNPPDHAERKRLENIARARLWKAVNRERHLAASRARYRATHERTCKGSAGEDCNRDVTGTGKQRCTYHAWKRDLEVRGARKAASR